MKTLLLLLASVAAASAFALGVAVPAGEPFDLNLSSEKVKGFTRVFANGQTQTWNLDGPNKGTWVDAKGKKIPSSNFVFKAPGTLKIKKVTKEEAATYDYIELVKPPPPPPGVHVDPFPRGFDLSVQK
ncbi:unnamed protein product [Caenorhabditis sp. 36 PRJEB53466]|nr:unnamed protein product [Caenorhabditis sp. 36 PRJEB53466]